MTYSPGDIRALIVDLLPLISQRMSVRVTAETAVQGNRITLIGYLIRSGIGDRRLIGRSVDVHHCDLRGLAITDRQLDTIGTDEVWRKIGYLGG